MPQFAAVAYGGQLPSSRDRREYDRDRHLMTLDKTDLCPSGLGYRNHREVERAENRKDRAQSIFYDP